MELSVKIDAIEVRKMVAEVLEPGSALLSANAVRNLAAIIGLGSADLAGFMQDAGAVFAHPGCAQPWTKAEVCAAFSVPEHLLPDTTTSPAGSEVQHADGNQDDEKIRYVWLPRAQCTPEQREFAVGHDSTNNPPRCAIAVENLTEAQRELNLPVSEL